MSEIEKIKKYIDSTDISNRERYELGILDARAIKRTDDMLDAVYTAFLYGRAKGYRAAKAERGARA